MNLQSSPSPKGLKPWTKIMGREEVEGEAMVLIEKIRTNPKIIPIDFTRFPFLLIREKEYWCIPAEDLSTVLGENLNDPGRHDQSSLNEAF
jgi:hypothetical protein